MRSTTMYYESSPNDVLEELLSRVDGEEKTLQDMIVSDTACENCGEEMFERDLYLVCGNCSATRPIPDSESRAITARTVVIGKGRGRKIHNVPSDKNVQKRKDLEKVLEDLNRQAPTQVQLPKDILMTAARYYSDTQANKRDAIYNPETDEQLGEAPWVHRGNIMWEIIGAIIYFLAQEAGVVKRKRDISAFLKLSTDGFSRGEDIVRRLVSSGELDLYVDVEQSRVFALGYLQALSLEGGWHIEFVVEVVEFATLNNWGLNWKLSSRVAGCIWMLVVGTPAHRLGGKTISCADVEKATGNTKKTTLTKLGSVVAANPERFREIFDRYGVALPAGNKRKPRAPKANATKK